MIVPSMNFAEVRREYDRDVKNVPAVANKVEKEIRKTMNFRLGRREAMIKPVMTPRKNKWMVMYDFRMKDCHRLYVLTWYDEEGLKTAIGMEDDQLMVFNGHFLERYDDRMKLGIPIPEKRLHHFLLSCDGSFTIDSKPEFNSSHYNIFTKMNCGVALGYRMNEEKIIHFSTFISEAMLYPNQRKVYDSLKETSRIYDDMDRLKKDIRL